MSVVTASDKTWQSPPLFMSHEACASASQLFDRFTLANRMLGGSDIDQAKDYVLRGDWKDYDRIYLSLYTLYLGGMKKIPPIDVGYSDRIKKRVGILFSDEMASDGHPKQFLNELSVASMIRFKSAFESSTPFTTSLCSVGFGCFYMGFDVVMPPKASMAKIFPELSAAEAANELFDIYLSESKLNAMKQEFDIAFIARD